MALRHTNLAAVERRAVSLRNAHARATDPTKVTSMPFMLFADTMSIGNLPVSLNKSIFDKPPARPDPLIRSYQEKLYPNAYEDQLWPYTIKNPGIYPYKNFLEKKTTYNEKPSDTPTEADLTYTPPNPSADVLRLRLGKMALPNVNAETEADTIAAARSHYTADGNRQVYLAMALAEAAARGISINPDLSVEAVKVQVLPE